jgi:hypothetical protein
VLRILPVTAIGAIASLVEALAVFAWRLTVGAVLFANTVILALYL